MCKRYENSEDSALPYQNCQAFFSDRRKEKRRLLSRDNYFVTKYPLLVLTMKSRKKEQLKENKQR